MATVIDSLIVELGLDPAKFTKGQKEAAAALTKTKDEVRKSGKEIEGSSSSMDQYFSRLRGNVLALFAAFTAGKGLKEFIQDTVQADADMGRFAKVLDTTVGTLSAWRNIAVLAGGSAAGMQGSIQGLVSQFQTFALTGESSVIPYFRALGVDIADQNGKMRATGDILLDLSDKFSKLDPARAAAFGQALGLDPGTINLLVQGRGAVAALLKEQKSLGTVTKEDAEAAIKFQHSWGALEQSSSTLGRTLLTELAPVLIKILDGLTAFAVWARQHGPFIRAVFTGLAVAATALAIALLAPYAEIIAITAAVVAMIVVFALLYDDWQTWMNGGKSLFGNFYSSVADGFKDFVKTFQDGFAVIRDLFHGDLTKALTDGKKFFADGIRTGVDVVHAAAGIANPLVRPFVPAATRAVNAILGRGDAAQGTPSQQAMAAAQASEKKYGIPAGVTYAQWALESSHGTRMPAGSNNPFGIKARAGQPYVEAMTTEVIAGHAQRVMARFAKYASLADAFDAHAKLLATSPAYARARGQGTAGGFADALTGVYATDPNYGAKLRAIMGSAAAGSTSSSSTKIDTLNVYSQAKDAPGIAADIRKALEQNSFAAQANYGPA